MNPKARRTDIVVSETTDETLVYDLNTNKAYCLNETSALAWRLCNGERSLAEISEVMSLNMKTPVSEELVWLALHGLKKEGLLEEKDAVETEFKGMTRRQVVKKAGLASMIALPLILSVVAPSAARAQSGGVVPGELFSPCEIGFDQDCAGSFALNICVECLGCRYPTGICCAPSTTREADESFMPGIGRCAADDISCIVWGLSHCCAGRGATFNATKACAPADVFNSNCLCN